MHACTLACLHAYMLTCLDAYMLTCLQAHVRECLHAHTYNRRRYHYQRCTEPAASFDHTTVTSLGGLSLMRYGSVYTPPTTSSLRAAILAPSPTTMHVFTTAQDCIKRQVRLSIAELPCRLGERWED